MADELNRWLRAVRPHTKADDEWSESPEGTAALEAIHARIDAKPRRWSVNRSAWLPSASIGAATAAVITVVALSASPVDKANPGSPSIGGNRTVPLGMRPVAKLLTVYPSCEQLLAGLRQHTADTIAKNGYYAYYAYPAYYGEVARGAVNGPALVTDSLAASTPAPATSTTNVQEVGVDEPDIVKTDGDRVVAVTNGVLHVMSAATRNETGTLDLRMYANAESAQLLVSGTHAFVILSGYPNYYGGPIAYARPYGYSGAATNQSTILSIDLADAPKVESSIQVDGMYVDARMVGTTVRLVAASSPDLPLPVQTGQPAKDKSRNVAAIRRASLGAWLPSYTISKGGTTTKREVSCSSVSHPATYSGTSMLTVYTLDMAHPGSDPMPVSIAADGQTVYATQSSLYVASQPSYCFDCPNPTGDTQLHRFDIQGTDRPQYLGSGQVKGSLLSSYSMSDYDGHLRVATTNGTDNAVYVLDDNTLTMTGKVTGLGKGERLYAVRFVGPLGYVVTFQQTDPLYVIDLRDPAAPRAVGELALTGFSSYLHDIGNGRLIGVGQEANAQGMVAGLQVSLFDVSTPSKPTRLGHDVVSHSQGESEFDPHAFLYWAPTGLVAVPVQSWDQTNAGKVLVLDVHGSQLTHVGLVANSDATAGNDQIVRSMIVDDQLWTLSAGGIKVSNADNLHQESWIPFS